MMYKIEMCGTDRITDGKLVGEKLDAQALLLLRNCRALRPQRQLTGRHAQFVVCVPAQEFGDTA